MRTFVLAALVATTAQALYAQGVDRRKLVLDDRDRFQNALEWHYNDLEAGTRAAKAAGKPLFVVVRCIPCENCQKFDDDVARRDPIVRDLMDQYVCVRIPMANTLDLGQFQFDLDQSFAAFLMHPDGTIYARFGTRSNRPEEDDIALEGLRKAMAEALAMSKRHEEVKPRLAGKQPKPVKFRSPSEFPALAGKYQSRLDYEGKVVQSCLHCHQVRDAERQMIRAANLPMPDEVLFPYPDPSIIGLTMDPKEMATIAAVAPGSAAERDGLKAGDRIVSLDGQPLLSIADLQWVFHNAAASARLDAEVVRDGQTKRLALTLDEGWRRGGNIAWRVSTWNLRRMGFGGMVLEDLSDEERRQARLGLAQMALRIKHVGEFGEHAIAKRAGFRKGDLVIGFDGLKDRRTETELLTHVMREKRPGDVLTIAVLRDGKPQDLSLTLP